MGEFGTDSFFANKEKRHSISFLLEKESDGHLFRESVLVPPFQHVRDLLDLLF